MSSPPLELQAAILGLVQGICEFLPISSSAHLVVLPEILGWPYLGKAFDVALHAGTLLALTHHFRDDLKELGRAGQRLVFSGGRARDPGARLVALLLVGTVPAAVAGFFLDKLLEPHLQGLLPIALFSIVWGVLLGWVEQEQKPDSAHTRLDALPLGMAFLIGCAQAAALLPGTSRTGVTMMAALVVGLSRPAAARFSLLLSLPVVAGATLWKGWSAAASAEGLEWQVVLAGVSCSALAGGLCLRNFLAYLEHGDLRPFAVYRVAFGIAVLWYWLNA